MVVSRGEAISLGSKTYRTEKPCLRGHIADRYVSSKGCVECSRSDFRNETSTQRQARIKRATDWAKVNRKRANRHLNAWQKRNPAKMNAMNAARRAAKLKATPVWLTDEHKAEIAHIYATCPKGWHVDHEVPLQGKNVCGLHVPWNLQHLHGPANLSKGNRY